MLLSDKSEIKPLLHEKSNIYQTDNNDVCIPMEYTFNFDTFNFDTFNFDTFNFDTFNFGTFNFGQEYWKPLLLNVDIDDILSLAITCKQALESYKQLSIYKFNQERISLPLVIHKLSSEFNNHPHNHICTAQSQEYLDRAVEICKRHSDLTQSIKSLTDSNNNISVENKQELSLNEIRLHSIISEPGFIPQELFTNILESGINNSSIFTTQEEDDNLHYLANYVNYPNTFSRQRHPFKNIIIQLLIFMILASIAIYGLYQYYITVPSGDNLKHIHTLNRTKYPTISEAMRMSYPYVNNACVGILELKTRHTRYRDSTLSISPTGCFLNTKAIHYVNFTGCVNALHIFNMNVSYWTQIISEHSQYKYKILCAPNLDSRTVACGQMYYDIISNEILFQFNIADFICMNKYWTISFILLIIFVFIGTTATVWGLLGYCSEQKQYCHRTCAIGLILYTICCICIYVMSLVYK